MPDTIQTIKDSPHTKRIKTVSLLMQASLFKISDYSTRLGIKKRYLSKRSQWSASHKATCYSTASPWTHFRQLSMQTCGSGGVFGQHLEAFLCQFPAGRRSLVLVPNWIPHRLFAREKKRSRPSFLQTHIAKKNCYSISVISVVCLLYIWHAVIPKPGSLFKLGTVTC